MEVHVTIGSATFSQNKTYLNVHKSTRTFKKIHKQHSTWISPAINKHRSNQCEIFIIQEWPHFNNNAFLVVLPAEFQSDCVYVQCHNPRLVFPEYHDNDVDWLQLRETLYMTFVLHISEFTKCNPLFHIITIRHKV